MVSIHVARDLSSLRFRRLFVRYFVKGGQVDRVFMDVRVFPVEGGCPAVSFRRDGAPAFRFSRALVLPRVLCLLRVQVGPGTVRAVPWVFHPGVPLVIRFCVAGRIARPAWKPDGTVLSQDDLHVWVRGHVDSLRRGELFLRFGFFRARPSFCVEYRL